MCDNNDKLYSRWSSYIKSVSKIFNPKEKCLCLCLSNANKSYLKLKFCILLNS